MSNSSISSVAIFGADSGAWRACNVTADGKLETSSTFESTSGLATEDKQDDQILELQSMATTLSSIDSEVNANGVTLSSIDSEVGSQSGTLTSINSNTAATSTDVASMVTTLSNIDSEIGSQSGTLTSISSNTAATSTDVASIDSKITYGNDDALGSAQQVLVYGRKDPTPSGLRALKCDFEGAVVNKPDNTGSDATLTDAQQVLCYGRDDTGTLDALKTDTNGRLEVVSSQPEPVLTPYTSFINNITLAANSQSTQTIDMNGYRNLQIVGQTGSGGDKLGLAFYDGVSAWRSDGVEAGIFNDGTVNHFSLILRNIGARSIKIENLQNQVISNLYVSHYRY